MTLTDNSLAPPIGLAPSGEREAEMKHFWKIFTVWFAAFICFFVLANLAGLIRPMGLLPFRYTGFPFTFAAWGNSIAEFFNWCLLALNGGIAVMVAGLLAWGLAWRRCRKNVLSQLPDE